MFAAAATREGFALDAAQTAAVQVLAAGGENVYLWGPVGRGKSWLMATYFAALPARRKKRLHFHEFFRDLHRAIRRHHNDLDAALDELLHGLDVVCFDEFHVHDPADGVFVTRLLPALLARHIRVVLTSNYPPDGLLPNPLFHDDFVPTIRLIERATRVVTVDGPLDYRTVSRTSTGFAAGWWVSPGGTEQSAGLGLTPPEGGGGVLAPAGHPVRYLGASGRRIWFDFAGLCENTTAPVDYLAVADRFTEWVIGDVPDLRTAGREPAQRFANVVDVLYDRDVTPLFVATVPLRELAEGDRLPVDIARVLSRLGQLRRLDEPGDAVVGNAFRPSP